MNTDKLLQAIQILVKEEVKQQLSGIIKEAVRAEMKKVLAEQKQPKNTGLSMAKAILGDDEPKLAEQKTYTKNPMINQILNETRAAVSNDGGYRTMSFLSLSKDLRSNGSSIRTKACTRYKKI